MSELLFSIAFTLLGHDTTWLESIAVGMTLSMILCNILSLHWGWPLAAISSVLYFFLFWSQHLYGEACLQVLFVGLALWGWWVWLRGLDGAPLPITRIQPRQRLILSSVGILLWLTTGTLLLKFTDTDVPWWDAFPTALSVLGQYLLAHKRLENWLIWMLVNFVATWLFVWKGLWLTALLYLVLILLSAVGWRAWATQLKVQS